MKLHKYLSELKKRNVFKQVLAYLLVAWIIIQAAAIILPTFSAPPYVMKVIIFILVVGFVIWLIFSWIYEITPDGIKKTSGLEHKEPGQSTPYRRLNIIKIYGCIAPGQSESK